MGESYAIGRYLGSVLGYYPKDERLAYEVDYLLEGYEPCLKGCAEPFFSKGSQHEEQLQKLFDQTLPKFLGVVEPLCAKGGWLVGDDLTVADFWIGCLYTNYINNKNITFGKDKWATCLNDFPNFKAYGEKFTEAMKKRIEKRGDCAI